MYFVKYGEDYLHDPRVQDCSLFDLTLTSEENSCGYCDFTIYPDHPMYGKLKERDADNQILVYDDDTLLFAGFIYELGKEFYLDGSVKCKGELDYLGESIIRPYSTIQRGFGKKAPTTLSDYFEWIIDQHNSQVKTNKQFVVGINQAASLDSDNFIFQENDGFPRTIDEISDRLLNNFGGYITTRHENGIRYIDYLSEWTESNSQILDFGVNLTNYTQIDDSSSLATYVIPLGAKMSETEYEYDDGYAVTTDVVFDPSKIYYTLGENGYIQCNDDMTSFTAGVTYYEYTFDNDESNLYLTVSGIPDGEYMYDGYKKTGDIIYCESAVNKYGWIGAKYNNSDLTTVEELVVYGAIMLKDMISPKRTIEIKAVDMHFINPNIKPIKIGEFVRVRSKPHGLDGYFLCRSIDLDLNHPENSLYTLGTTFDTLTGEQNKRINELNSTINKQYEAAAILTAEAKESAKEAVTMAKNAVAMISEKLAPSIDTEIEPDLIVTSVVEEYAVSLEADSSPTDGWSKNIPDYTTYKFVWRRLVIEHVDGTIRYGQPALLMGNAGQKGEDAVLLRIDSSRGTVFKNDSISTILSVKIYKGSERIDNITTLRSVFGSEAHLQWSWQKKTDNTFGVISVDDQMISNDGFDLTISSDEVDTKVTFMCELVV